LFEDKLTKDYKTTIVIPKFTPNVACLCLETRKRFQKGQKTESVLSLSPGKDGFCSSVTKHDRRRKPGTIFFRRGDYRSTGYRSTDYRSTDYRSTGYRSTDYRSTDYRSTDYRSTDYRSTGYRSTDYRSTGYRSTGYRSTDYRSTDYRSTGYKPENCPGFVSL
jgi:hypothetical protein